MQQNAHLHLQAKEFERNLEELQSEIDTLHELNTELNEKCLGQ